MHLDKRGLVLSTIGKPIQYKGNLLLRLGGKEDLFAILTTLCIQLQNDSMLSKFYGAYKVEDLRLLIIDFFNAALLLDFPRGFDLKQHIAITQYHQLSTGMGPEEFDLLIQAFRKAFCAEPIPEDVVEEVMDYLAALRIFFDDEKMRQRAKKIAFSMEQEQEEEEKEISVTSGHDNDTSRIRSWSKGSKGRRRRKLNHSPAHSSEQHHHHEDTNNTTDAPIRRMPRRGSLQYRIKSVMPVRRISVPKEHDKDPGMLVKPQKKLLSRNSSSLSSSQELENVKRDASASRSPGRTSKSPHSRASNKANPETRKPPTTGSFSFSASQNGSEKPIRRMPRRGSLQYRIKSVMPVRRISVPKENDKDPGMTTLKKRPSKVQQPQEPKVTTTVPVVENGFTDGRVTVRTSGGEATTTTTTKKKTPTGSFSFATSQDVEKPVRRQPRRGSLQYRIKSVLPARRISVPKENDKDPGPMLVPTKQASSKPSLQTRPSLRSTDSKGSMRSGKSRTTSPHGRFSNFMRRMGSKDKRNLNYNGGYNSSSDDEDFVSSEELEDHKMIMQQEAPPPTRPSVTKQAKGSYKATSTTTTTTATTKPQHHELPRRTQAYVDQQGNSCGGTSDLIRSSSWENALVL